MNQQGREVFGDNYIHIDDQMSGRQIVEVTRDALADRGKLKHLADRMCGVMQSSYTLAENERKLFELTVQIAQST